MNNQLVKRCAGPFVRHVLSRFCAGDVSAADASSTLGVSRSRLYTLKTEYLLANAGGLGEEWRPGLSGGNHAGDWPADVHGLLRKRLGSDPPSSYAFAASEALRLHGFRVDRAQVRHWAARNGLAHPSRAERPPAAVRRWQSRNVGELWQLDATPHRWFGKDLPMLPMFNMLDACTRFQTGGRIYGRETLEAYLHFLSSAFERHGLPLCLYVDYASVFRANEPGGFTRLGKALQFYGVALLFTNTPQAKGKIERNHQVWQDRLSAFFASECVRGELGEANGHIDALVGHRNQHEVHREIGMTPAEAWTLADAEGRNSLRSAPRCPWRPYVWSIRRGVQVGNSGRVSIDMHTVRVDATPRSWVVLCDHTDGHHSVIAAHPVAGALPVVLFTDRPKRT
jgi:hypothetical protein